MLVGGPNLNFGVGEGAGHGAAQASELFFERRLLDGAGGDVSGPGQQQPRAEALEVVPTAAAVAAIDHPRRSLGVVAPGEAPDPVGAVAGGLGDFARQQPFAQQPDDLPPAAFGGFGGPPVPLFQFRDAQVRSHFDPVHA